MSRSVRVLHVIQNLNYGGMERLLADIVRKVDPNQVESHVLCLQYVGRFGEEMKGTASIHLAEPMSRYSMVWPGSLIHQIGTLAPHVVHTHSGVWYKAALAARRAGVPYVIHTEHGRRKPDPLQHRLVDRLAARNTTVVVAVSDLLGEELVAKRIASPYQIRVIRNGVDTTIFQPRADNGVIRRALGISGDTPVIGSVGRLEPIKGYDVMIEAYAALRATWKRGPAPALVVGGEGSQRPELAEKIAAHGLSETVHLLGWRDDIHDLHAAFDLFTLSSRSEGTSVSLLEAMSAGLCPVVTDVGGNAAVLGPELQHRLVPPESPSRLADAWTRALHDIAQRSHDGEIARKRVVDAFSLEAMVHQYQELYLDVNPPVVGRKTLAPAVRSD